MREQAVLCTAGKAQHLVVKTAASADQDFVCTASPLLARQEGSWVHRRSRKVAMRVKLLPAIQEETPVKITAESLEFGVGVLTGKLTLISSTGAATPLTSAGQAF